MSQEEKEQIDRILQSRDYYEILNVSRFGLDQDELRRNYIKLARKIHPDKHQNDPRATQAFQKLSTAYETLMNPSSRMSYDLGGASMGAQNVNADEVLDEVLRKIYEDFFSGDFEYILNMVDVLNETATHDPRYRRADGQPPLDRQRVKESLTYLRGQLTHAGQIKEELREPLVQFCDVWYKFKDCYWYQLFTRVQLGLEMLHIVCRMPLQAESITLPPLVTRVMSATASTVYYTKQGLEMIGSLSTDFMTHISTQSQEGEGASGGANNGSSARVAEPAEGPGQVSDQFQGSDQLYECEPQEAPLD